MEEWHRLRQEIRRLEAVQGALLDGLLESKPFQRGSILRRFLVCGKPGCRCTRGERHGPFYYLSESEHGRRRLRYLGTEAKARPVIEGVQAHQRWRRLRRDLRKAEQALEGLLDRLGTVLETAAAEGVQAWRTPCGVRLHKRPEKPC